MATFTDSLGFDKGAAGFPDKGTRHVTMVSVDLDMAAITAARSAAGAAVIANNDILEVIQVPAKTLVLAVGLDVTTAEGGTCTIDVGDGVTADGYLDGVNANTVASYASSGNDEDFKMGKYYGGADTIDVKFINAADAAVMRLWALMADCSN